MQGRISCKPSYAWNVISPTLWNERAVGGYLGDNGVMVCGLSGTRSTVSFDMTIAAALPRAADAPHLNERLGPKTPHEGKGNTCPWDGIGSPPEWKVIKQFSGSWMNGAKK